MAAYTEMKNSGIDWIGVVPSHWSTHTLYQLVSQVKNKNKDLREKNLLSLSYGKIIRKDIDTTVGLLPESFEGYNIVEDGDVVLRLTDLQNDHTSLRVGLATECGIITSAYTTLHPSDSCVSKYLYYLLHTFDIRKGFYGMGSGVRQGLNYDEVKELRVILPSLKEQEAIAAYLDEQCILIDATIAEAKCSIEDYRAWRASIIFEAVTKGLDNDAKLIESGIDGLGKIHASSRIIKLRHLIENIESGVSVNAGQDAARGDEIGVLKTSCVSKNKFIAEENKNVNREEYSRVACPVKGNSLIVSRMNTPELVGACGYVDKDYPNLFLPDRLWQITCLPTCNTKYVWYFLSSKYTRNYYASLATGTSSSMQNISQAQFGNLRVALPNIEEQERIAKYLDAICEQIDAITENTQALIANLESYKRSLIFEVVTGKRKVVQ